MKDEELLFLTVRKGDLVLPVTSFDNQAFDPGAKGSLASLASREASFAPDRSSQSASAVAFGFASHTEGNADGK